MIKSRSPLHPVFQMAFAPWVRFDVQPKAPANVSSPKAKPTPTPKAKVELPSLYQRDVARALLLLTDRLIVGDDYESAAAYACQKHYVSLPHLEQAYKQQLELK